MKKQNLKISLIVLMTLLTINIVSAVAIDIIPAEIEIDADSGDTIIKNITIITDGNYLVYLFYSVSGNSTNIEGLSVNFTSPIWVEGVKETTLEINIDPLFIEDSFNITINANIEVEDPPGDGSPGGNGGHMWFWKGNETEEDDTIYEIICGDGICEGDEEATCCIDCGCPEGLICENNECMPIAEEEIIPEESVWDVLKESWYLLLLGLIIVGVILYIIFRKTTPSITPLIEDKVGDVTESD